MSNNFVKTNHMIIKGGKLLPRPTTPTNEKKNYRYIPYDPLNRPGPDDYFRETITRLQQQNNALRKQLDEKPHQIPMVKSTTSLSSAHDFKLKLEISQLQNSVRKLQSQLDAKNSQLSHKDKQILELTNQNTRLHLRVQNFIKQLDSLHAILDHKDEEIQQKNEAIRNYCKTIEELAKKDYQEQKTAFSSDYYNGTPRIEEKDQEYEEEDEQDFYSIEYKSNTDQISKNRMFMTPDNHSFISIEEPIEYQSEEIRRYSTEEEDYENDIKKNQKTQESDDKYFTPLTSPSNKRPFSSEGEKRVISNSSSNESLNNLSENLNSWNDWASAIKNGRFMTLDLIDEDNPQPLAGGFLSLFKRE